MDTAAQNKFRVFISSTFRDMQEERDVLIKRTFPRFQDFCEKLGVNFASVDLRWGITEQQASEGKILPICFQEIDNCSPFFLGIIGERYGSTIGELPGDFLSTQAWLQPYQNRSVTELEIIYGALHRDPQQTKAYFYFKDSGSQTAVEPSIEQLKTSVIQSGYPHKYYRNTEELDEFIYEDLLEALGSIEEAGAFQEKQEDSLHQSFAKVRSQLYIGEKKYFNLLDQFVLSHGRPLVLFGPSGIGKSALLANWLLLKQNYQFARAPVLQSDLLDEINHFMRSIFYRLIYRHQEEDTEYLIHFVGASRESNNWYNLVKRIIESIRTLFGLNLQISTQEEGLRLGLINCFHAIDKDKKLVIVIDGLDQLEDREQALDLGWLPSEIPSNIRLIVSSSGGPTLGALKKRNWDLIEITPWNQAQAEIYIAAYLKLFGKTLDAESRRAIARNPMITSPIFLKIFMEEIRVIGQYEEVGSQIRHYMESRSLKDLFKKVLKRVEQDEWVSQKEVLQRSMCLLWAARKGLLEREIQQLLGEDGAPLPNIYWAPVYLTMKEILLQQSGFFTLQHDELAAAVEELYLENGQKTAVRGQLVRFFSGADISMRFVDEVPWQLSLIEDWKQLYQLLRYPPFIRFSWHTHEYELKAYWNLLEKHTTITVGNTFNHWLDYEEIQGWDRWFVSKLLVDSGYYEQGLQWLSSLEEVLNNEPNDSLLQQVLSLKAVVLHQKGQLDQSLLALKEEERYCRLLDRRHLLAACLGNQASALLRKKEWQQAEKCLNENEEIVQEIDDFVGLSAIYGTRGVVAYNKGDLKNASRLFQQQEQLAQTIGYLPGIAQAAMYHGALWYKKNKSNKATGSLLKANRLFREMGDKQLLQESLGRLCTIYLEQADYDGAISAMEEREKINQDIGNHYELLQTYYHYIELYADKLNQYAFARIYLKKAEGLVGLHGFVGEGERLERLREAIC